MPEVLTTAAATLKERWEQFKEENPRVRIREAANQLGVSEAELLATGLGDDVIKLFGFPHRNPIPAAFCWRPW